MDVVDANKRKTYHGCDREGTMVRVLSDEDVAAVLSVDDVLPVVADAVRKQDAGAVERPDRPHFPVGEGLDGRDDPWGTGLTMPAYVHGADCYATKLASVHPENEDRPTVNAQIALTDARTGAPVAYLAGNRITNARTGCLGGLSVAALTDGPVTLGLVGAGTQARWQAAAVDAATDLARVRIYSPSDSRFACARDIESDTGVPAEAVETPRDAVLDADAVITATTATAPVFPADALDRDAVVVAVGAYTSEMQELPPAVLREASAVFADVPSEAAETGDALAADMDETAFRPLSDALDGSFDAGVRVVLSVGSAVFDAAVADHVYELVAEDDVGRDVDL